MFSLSSKEGIMVGPVSGPFYKSSSLPVGSPVPFYRFDQKSYRQRKPFNVPLPYSSSKYLSGPILDPLDRFGWLGGYGIRYASVTSYFSVKDQNLIDLAYAKAYGKLTDALGDQSLWLVNLIEVEQSLAMITKRAIQLSRFARALNRFDFPSAAKHLGVDLKKVKNLKSSAKASANNWLEFHFGWDPLVKDINAAVQTLNNRPAYNTVVEGKASVTTDKSHSGGNDQTLTVYHEVFRTRVRMSARVSVVNPNLFLANQLGLVNLASTALEVVKFSFIADWFSNLGQFVSSLTTFAGLSVDLPQYTTYQSAVGRVDVTWKADSYRASAFWGTIFTDRYTGSLPGPPFVIKPWKAPSAVRAATAVSLLIQQVRS
jgi:hypothetical protein